MKKHELSKRIYDFLDKYAAIRPDFEEGDDIEEKYASPDAYELLACAKRLEKDEKPFRFPFSEWSSGGYKPYSSKKGREEHDFLLKEIEKQL